MTSPIGIPIISQYMHCAICNAPSALFREALLLDKHQIVYYRCSKCGFIQTETPYWLSEAYSEAMQLIDVGIMQRNLQNAVITPAVIHMLFPSAQKFLDYGGGYGTLVRLMRDRGFDFYWQDLYAKNVHARSFEHAPDTHDDLVTAFELLEHLPNPPEGISRRFADNVLGTILAVADLRRRRRIGGTTRFEAANMFCSTLLPPCSISPVILTGMSCPLAAIICLLAGR